ncbi:MAG: hypothetical protein LBF22_11730 [Deltaproteobacteria bacterium]|jgi:hypothetical protein|nr:hypothetical protein [Deltaproteobacteria bacterium]
MLSQGLINFTDIDNFETDNITMNGRALQWVKGNSKNISEKLNALGSNNGFLNTNDVNPDRSRNFVYCRLTGRFVSRF